MEAFKSHPLVKVGNPASNKGETLRNSNHCHKNRLNFGKFIFVCEKIVNEILENDFV